MVKMTKILCCDSFLTHLLLCTVETELTQPRGRLRDSLSFITVACFSRTTFHEVHNLSTVFRPYNEGH